MTDKKSRRVVIINNIDSDTIDQAIFILKSDKRDALPARANNSVAYEAQRIINNYIRQVERIKITNSAPSPRKHRGMTRIASLAAAIAAFAVLCAVYLLAGRVMY